MICRDAQPAVLCPPQIPRRLEQGRDPILHRGGILEETMCLMRRYEPTFDDTKQRQAELGFSVTKNLAH